MGQAVALNLMQRLLCQWETAHPYNAAQVMSLDPGPNVAAAQTAWEHTLRYLGLGQIRWDGPRYGFDPQTTGLVTVVPRGTCLESFLSDELNRRFETDMPLRPFILEQGQACCVGVVYRHWIADSASIRLLMHAWLERIVDPSRAAPPAVALSAASYWQLFGPAAGHWRIDRSALDMVRSFSHLRRAQRVRTAGALDLRFLLRHFPSGTSDALRQAARRAGATVTDLLLATMAVVCAAHVPARPLRRRPDLALGAVVDLRRRRGSALDNTFGLFLGYQNMVLRRALLEDWPRLLDHVARTSRLRKAAGPGVSMLWAASGLAWGRFVPAAQRGQFFRRHMPLSGSISSVDLSNSPLAAYYLRPLREYIRVSPTGPMEPLMFTPTSLGDQFHVGLSVRTGIIDDPAALADDFAARVLRLAEHAA